MTEAAAAADRPRPRPRKIPVRFLSTTLKEDGQREVTCLIFPTRLERVAEGNVLLDPSGGEWKVREIAPFKVDKFVVARTLAPVLQSAWTMVVVAAASGAEPLAHGAWLTPKA